MKIQLKRSNVLEGGVAKQPTAGQMEYGELAVNYNGTDPAIFIKDSNNDIVRLNPTIGDGTITISANGQTVGTFTVNQEGDTEIELPDSGKLNPPSPDEPGGSPENGDLWLDTSECPPVLKIWSDCDGVGQWYLLATAGPQPINPQPGDGNNSISPGVPGSGTEADPYILTAATVEYGETAESVETISLIGQTPANLVSFVDLNSGTNGNRFAQPVGVIAADGTWSGKVYFEDAPESSSELTYEGLLKLGGLHYKWAVTMEEPAKLEVGKGQLSPTSGETGDTFTGSATVLNAENPVEVHVFSLDGVEKQRGASNSYVPTEAGNLTYHKEVTDDNNQSAVVGEESDAAVIIVPPGPSATMSGLRFDLNRMTALQKTLNIGKVFTFSVWIKQTDRNADFVILGQTGSAYFSKRGDGSFYFKTSAGDLQTAVQPFDTWLHVVLQSDNDGSTIFVNGVEAAANTGTSTFGNALTYIGREAASTPYARGGYMSECYFADGKVAPPTTFGKLFPGDKWGPLDNAVVEDNLDALQPADPTPPPGPGDTKTQPYDSRANTDQVWSASGWGTNARDPISNFFDGNPNTSLRPDIDSTLTWTLPTPIPVGSGVRIYGRTGGSRTDQITIRDSEGNTSQIKPPNYPSEGWVAASGLSGNLVSISIVQQTATSDPSIRIIEVDGRMLVDQGLWNNSQNWSDGASNSDGTYPVTQLFDGVFGGDGSKNAVDLKLGVITFNPPLSYTSSFGVYANGSNMQLDINGDGQSIGDPSNDGSLVSVKTGSGTISSIAGASTSLAAWLYGLNIDGKKLVDAGAQWDTSQKWSDNFTAGTGFAAPATNAFDGNDTTEAYSNSNDDTLTMHFDPPVTGKLEVIIPNGGIFKNLSGSTIGTFNAGIWSYTASNFTGFTIEQDGGRPNPKLMRLGGKVLVDGTATWNTSERWADYLSASGGTSYIENPDNAFDGDVASLAQLKSSTNGDQLIFGATLTGVTKLDVLSRSVCDISGTGFSTISGAAAGWVTLYDGGSTTISNLTLTKTGNDPGIYAIRMNGEILVDGAPTWNSSQTWSNSLTTSGSFNGSDPAVNAFDGSLTTKAGTTETGGGAVITFTGPVAYTESVRVYTYWGSPHNVSVSLNGGGGVSYPGNQWKTVATGSGTINTLTFTGTSNSAGVSAIEVDGEILVDAGLGDNGFYLPFDPAQTGANYTSGVTIDEPSKVIGTPSMMFDGNLSSTRYQIGADTGASKNSMTWTMPTGVTNALLRIYVRTAPEITNPTLKLYNGGSEIYSGPLSKSSAGWVSVGTYTFDKVEIEQNNSSSSTLYATEVYGFEIGGELYVDHSSIGEDMSGNNNHFHDQNFGVGNSSQMWSKNANEFWATAAPANQAFDGSITTRAYPNDTSLPNSAVVTFASAIPINNSLRVFVGTGGNNTNGSVSINGTNVTSQLPSGSSDGQWATITGFSTLTSVAVGRSASTTYNSLYAVEVDGEMLINPSFVDTVLDTPMKSYAILDGGRNGGLNLTAGQPNVKLATMKIPSTGKYYFEYYMIDTTSMSVGVRNAGVTSPPSPNTEISITADGTRNDGDGTQTVGYLSALQPGDVVGVLVDVDGDTVEFTLNGVAGGTPVALSNLSGDPQPFGYVNSNSNFNVNFGQQAYVHTPSAGYDGLYQTWEEYARSSLGYALDRVAQLEALRLLDAATIEDLRTQIAGALSRLASLESDEVNDDAVDNSLVTLVGNLSSQIIAFNTRIADAESRITSLEG